MEITKTMVNDAVRHYTDEARVLAAKVELGMLEASTTQDAKYARKCALSARDAAGSVIDQYRLAVCAVDESDHHDSSKTVVLCDIRNTAMLAIKDAKATDNACIRLAQIVTE